MKIVADENIPLLHDYFNSHAELLLKPGRAITHNDLLDADILLVRSVTKVDKLLLQDTPVKYVGSTTAGSDHLDTAWLDEVGIQWGVATACNAMAVAEYVVCVVAALQKQRLLTETKLRAGVIGVGNVGRLVVEKLQGLGFDVLQCDPIRAENEKDFQHTPLTEFNDLDLISIHAPLTTGRYTTYHLIEKNFLQRQKDHCILLNAGRGAVISFDDLKQYGTHLNWCLDVWEHEPIIDEEVLQQCIIATPHIAGYSVQSKLRGVEIIYQDMVRKNLISAALTKPMRNFLRKTILLKQNYNWRDVVLSIYDPLVTTERMKQHIPFDELRKDSNSRYEFAFVDIDLIN